MSDNAPFLSVSQRGRELLADALAVAFAHGITAKDASVTDMIRRMFDRPPVTSLAAYIGNLESERAVAFDCPLHSESARAARDEDRAQPFRGRPVL